MKTEAGLKIAREGNVAIASFTSSCICDIEEIANASAQLRQYIEADLPSRIVFDFAGVTFLSSRVLSLLLEARACLEPHGGETVIASLSPQLQKVFEIAHLDSVFKFYPDRATAVQKLPGSPN
jgi:anti-anti-sigma factor